MKKIYIGVVFLLLVIGSLTLIRLFVLGEEKESFIESRGITKVGIISVWSDLDNKQYALKEEIEVMDKETIDKFIEIINNGTLSKGLLMDRLPHEYELKIYYKDRIIRCSYGYEESQYNMQIQGVSGVITIDHRIMDELIIGVTGEVNRQKNVNPY
ncbi:hypothetical protein EDC18_101370 [Natranaerovirga pectinivora]|uniref:Uncharacterized protein n=1 Tax=Natranaerovirga pectinivora TaxID=682400 RepID=A0A4R3MQK8_9FIRM|nr:hypothetical protein [Natranaerovirga pectinivora]TCT17074.1 hypothetical protein EDC18_101370 [Natranaerovirga pectinivora]